MKKAGAALIIYTKVYDLCPVLPLIRLIRSRERDDRGEKSMIAIINKSHRGRRLCAIIIFYFNKLLLSIEFLSITPFMSSSFHHSLNRRCVRYNLSPSNSNNLHIKVLLGLFLDFY